MSLIERGDGGFAQTLAEGDDACIYEPQMEVFIGALQLGGACQIGIGWMCHPVCTSVDVGNEVSPNFDSGELDEPVVDLDEYRTWYQQVPLS